MWLRHSIRENLFHFHLYELGALDSCLERNKKVYSMQRLKEPCNSNWGITHTSDATTIRNIAPRSSTVPLLMLLTWMMLYLVVVMPPDAECLGNCLESITTILSLDVIYRPFVFEVLWKHTAGDGNGAQPYIVFKMYSNCLPFWGYNVCMFVLVNWGHHIVVSSNLKNIGHVRRKVFRKYSPNMGWLTMWRYLHQKLVKLMTFHGWDLLTS